MKAYFASLSRSLQCTIRQIIDAGHASDDVARSYGDATKTWAHLKNANRGGAFWSLISGLDRSANAAVATEALLRIINYYRVKSFDNCNNLSAEDAPDYAAGFAYLQSKGFDVGDLDDRFENMSPPERYDQSDIMETWERLSGFLQKHMRDPRARAVILKQVVQTAAFPNIDDADSMASAWQEYGTDFYRANDECEKTFDARAGVLEMSGWPVRMPARFRDDPLLSNVLVPFPSLMNKVDGASYTYDEVDANATRVARFRMRVANNNQLVIQRMFASEWCQAFSVERLPATKDLPFA